jgi:hypothetical protein
MRLELAALLGLGCGQVGFDRAGAGADAGLAGSDGGLPPGWTTTVPLPGPRGRTCAVSLDDHLYVLGGSSTDPLDEVLSADLAVDGSVVRWRPLTPLPEANHWHAGAVDPVSRTLYVVGGDAATVARSTVWRAAVDGAGALGPWTPDAPLLGPRRGLAAFVAGQDLYAAGGESGDGFLTQAAVFRTEINPADGTLLGWEAATPLPAADYMFGAVAIAAQVYLTGGYAAPSAVWTGNAGQALTPATALPGPRQRHASVALDGYLYVLGGEPTFGGTNLDQVARAPVSGPAVGAWEVLAPLPAALAYLSATVVRGRIYVVGGSTETQDVADAFVLTPPP